MTIIAAPEEQVTALAVAGRVRSTRRSAVPTGAMIGPWPGWYELGRVRLRTHR
jgi:hypothetical protein